MTGWDSTPIWTRQRAFRSWR